jgi:hypothetical protein
MSSAMFRTGLRAPHVVLAGALVPAGTVLVTPAPEAPARPHLSVCVPGPRCLHVPSEHHVYGHEWSFPV